MARRLVGCLLALLVRGDIDYAEFADLAADNLQRHAKENKLAPGIFLFGTGEVEKFVGNLFPPADATSAVFKQPLTRGRSAPDIIAAGFGNLLKEPLGWCFGSPAALRPSTVRVRPWLTYDPPTLHADADRSGGNVMTSDSSDGGSAPGSMAAICRFPYSESRCRCGENAPACIAVMWLSERSISVILLFFIRQRTKRSPSKSSVQCG